MIEDVVTWVVAADGSRARVFEERLRHGPLHEIEHLSLHIREEDRPHGGRHGATVHDRSGPGRHSGFDAPPAEEAERRFLRRVAQQLDQAAQEGAFERLVLMAPPRALGVLRQALSANCRRRVHLSEPHDRVQETAEGLRARLHSLRAPV
ncbi:MAG TPA: host attachment protein [Phenylobacterium sp.]